MSVKQSLFVQASPEKCSGCRACELACFASHAFGTAPAKEAKTIGVVDLPVVPNLFVVQAAGVSAPVQCHHCEDAPCLRACLPGAITRADGVVSVNPRRCIGCRNCALACPFGAIEICGAETAAKIAELFGADALQTQGGAVKHVFKCDLCAGLRDRPACVDACPNSALRLIDTEDEVTRKRISALESAPQNPQNKTCANQQNGGL
ncbi:MAG: 4Fe-4S dicluster domain-containing protein [Spirochaetaceae bacterium]|jgi:electron transport protein HydN|nr:4Fe-4S dicluster domain-containing protein [Spirochaetaceae bacterium]